MSKPTYEGLDKRVKELEKIEAEYKKVNRELSESEERYKGFFENTKDILIIADIDGNVTYVNKSIEEYGFKRDELIGKNQLDFIPEKYWQKAKEDLKEVLQGKTVEGDIEVKTPKGIRFVNYKDSPIKEEKKIVGFQTVIRDITESKKAEEAIKESEEKYRALVENSPNYINIFQDGMLKYVNNSMYKALGWTFEEITSPSFNFIEKIIPQRFQVLLKENIAKRFKGESVPQYEIALKTRDGSEIPIIVSAQLINYQGKTAAEVICVDITERKKAEEALLLSHANLTALIENTDDYAMIADQNGFPIMFNSAYAKIMKEALGIEMRPSIRPHKLLKDKNIVEWWDNLHKRVLSGEKFRVDYSHEFSKDNIRHLEVSFNPIYEDSKVIGFSEFTRDITERKRVENELLSLHKELETRIKVRTEDLRKTNKLLQVEIIERKKTEKSLYQSERELKIRNKISNIFLTTPGDEMYGKVLQIVLETLKSKYGVFGYIDEDGALVCPSMTRDIWSQCQISDKDIKFPRETWSGIWGKALIERKSIYSNKPFRVPEGHIPIIRALDAPITYQDEVIGNFLVGNKETDYDKKDQELLKTIANHIAPVLHARLEKEKIEKKRNETVEELKKAHDELETRVKERTARLREINDILIREIEERKKTEEALKESEEKFRTFMETASDLVHITDKDGNFDYVNEAMAKTLGYSKEEMIGMPIIQIVSEDTLKITHEKIKEELKEKERLRTEPILVTKNGRKIYGELSVVAIYDSNGNYAGSRGIFHDITERKNAEEKLRKSQELYQAVAESALAGICIADNQENITYVNPAFAKMLGYTRKQLMGMNVSQIADKEEFAKMKVMSQLRKKGIKSMYEAILRRKDGVPINVLLSGSPLMNPDGNIEGTMAVTINITERKKTEEKLLYERNLFQTFLNNIPDRIYFKDKNARFVRVSKSVVDLFNISLENIIGKTDLDFYKKQFAESKIEDDLDVIKTEKPIIGKETMDITMDGIKRWDSTTKLPWYDDNNNVIGIFGISRDITELKKKEEELKVSHKMLRNLSRYLQTVREKERTHIASEIHDDLGQALTVLQIDLFWLENKLPEDQKLLLDKIKTMLNLIDKTIKNTQRISSELRPALLEELGLVAEIESEAEEFQKRTGIKCETNIGFEDVILGKELSIALFRIFQETLTNIIRHAHAAKVKISLQKKAKNLVLVVEDNGKGITVKQISDPKSFGLIGMRERIYPWNGEVKIIGKKNKGTTVTVSVPVYR